jgi:plastocyanin
MLKNTPWVILGVLLTTASTAFAAEAKKQEIVEHNLLMDHGDGHLMDMDGGMVMGQNKDKLAPGCDKISEDVEITVRAGHKYSKDFPGTMFGFDKHEWRIKPCTRLTVHFINEDRIRHQWMMHGLPKFLYDKGMFHLEVTGPAKISGTLILPAEDRTYLVHCDIAQHMEKGMKGQLIVGKGGTPFPSIPGLTDLAIPDDYGPAPAAATPVVATKTAAPVAAPQPSATPAAKPADQSSSGTFILGIILGALGTPFVIANFRQRFKGMTAEEVVGYLANAGKRTFDRVLSHISALLKNSPPK